MTAEDRHAKRFVVGGDGAVSGVLWTFVAYWATSSRADTVESTAQVLRRIDHTVDEQTPASVQDGGTDVRHRRPVGPDHPASDPQTDKRFVRWPILQRPPDGVRSAFTCPDDRGNLMSPGLDLPAARFLGRCDFFP